MIKAFLKTPKGKITFIIWAILVLFFPITIIFPTTSTTPIYYISYGIMIVVASPFVYVWSIKYGFEGTRRFLYFSALISMVINWILT